MPLSAIATGAVDLVLPAAEIPAALVRYSRRKARQANGAATQDAAPDWLPEFVALLRTKTAHDFTLYKHGTLQRRIERRMAMTATAAGDMDRYRRNFARRHGRTQSAGQGSAHQRHELLPGSENIRILWRKRSFQT
jgi:hypothetical protein